MRRSRELQLNYSMYYFDSIERMASPLYLLTDKDILCSSVKTISITATNFKIGDVTYKLFDIGDQRANASIVAGLLLLTNMSEYGQVLYEDESMVCYFSLVAFLLPLMTFSESYSRSSDDFQLQM